jgi:large conductance mechanosensitive channel
MGTNTISGFKKFILRGNVVDLAVGVVIGSAFHNIVNSFVSDIISPFISLMGGQPDFSKYSLTIQGTKFAIGDFLNNIISFLIMALVIYFFVVVPINKLVSFSASKKPIEPTDKLCPYCFKNIPKKALRCPECTSKLPES